METQLACFAYQVVLSWTLRLPAADDKPFFRTFQISKLASQHCTKIEERSPTQSSGARGHWYWIWQIYLHWWLERREHHQRWCYDGWWLSYTGIFCKFRFCPSLWTQFFIISCKVDDTTYVPCVHALLPVTHQNSSQPHNNIFDLSLSLRTSLRVRWSSRMTTLGLARTQTGLRIGAVENMGNKLK